MNFCFVEEALQLFEALRGSSLQKLDKFVILFSFFLQKKGFLLLVEQVSKIYGASTTVSPQKMGPSGGNTLTFTTFPDDFVILL